MTGAAASAGAEELPVALPARRPCDGETPTHPGRLPAQDPGRLRPAQAQLQPHWARLDEFLQDADAPAGKAVLQGDGQTRPHATVLLLFLSHSFVDIWNGPGKRMEGSALPQPDTEGFTTILTRVSTRATATHIETGNRAVRLGVTQCWAVSVTYAERVTYTQDLI